MPESLQSLALQWGRGWLAAEGVLPAATAASRRLQWGRGWLAAEGSFTLASSIRAPWASMGPRLVSRGGSFCFFPL